MNAKKKDQPWLTPTGVAIPTVDLRALGRSWNPMTWENYLKWFESGQSEVLVAMATYQQIGDETSESIFESHGHKSSRLKTKICDELLASLPEVESEILRQHYLEGRTQTEIAAKLKRSQTGISHIKNRALQRLRREYAGDELLVFQFMRGVRSRDQQKVASIWDQPFSLPNFNAQNFEPENQKSEIEKIKNFSLRIALQSLSDLQRQIIYLRHWCQMSLRQIVGRLRMGINTVHDIYGAAISHVKRNYLIEELREISGGPTWN